MQSPFLIGAKVYLRALEREDAAVVQPWVNDSDVTRTLLMARPMSRHAEEDFIAAANKDERAVTLLIVTRDEERPVGVAGLHEIDLRNRSAQLGLFVGAKDCWGHGYGTEATKLLVDHAFATLNLHRVWLHVAAHNERARRSYLRVGFREEGVLRQAFYREGNYADLIAMAVLRADWDVLTSAKAEG
jgi:RimJ/RimL family protein N-acetyltransferase